MTDKHDPISRQQRFLEWRLIMVRIRLCRALLAKFRVWNRAGGRGFPPVDHEPLLVRLALLHEAKRCRRKGLAFPARQAEQMREACFGHFEEGE